MCTLCRQSGCGAGHCSPPVLVICHPDVLACALVRVPRYGDTTENRSFAPPAHVVALQVLTTRVTVSNFSLDRRVLSRRLVLCHLFAQLVLHPVVPERMRNRVGPGPTRTSLHRDAQESLRVEVPRRESNDRNHPDDRSRQRGCASSRPSYAQSARR